MLKLALGTGMKPSESCKFPFYGNAPNQHIAPESEMRESEAATVSYTVIRGKGVKTRAIVVNKVDLKELELTYTNKYYHERAKRYEKTYGKPCPPSILFLTKNGDPVHAKQISRRTPDAKDKAVKADETFRSGIWFYDSRG